MNALLRFYSALKVGVSAFPSTKSLFHWLHQRLRVGPKSFGYLRKADPPDTMRTLKSNIVLLMVALAVWTGERGTLVAAEITPAGQRLATVLDSMHVEELWLAGHRVNWRTGKPEGKPVTNGTSHTHCSAFAAAASEKLGTYLLRPPEHSATLLANAQQDWLLTEGTNQGWYAVSSPLKAQELANAGQLVVVTYKSRNAETPGHIAIVRPCAKSEDKILSEGPQIIQAGAQNHASTSAKEGFKHHRGAFENHELLYFAHPVSLPPLAGATADHPGSATAF
jgi:hypothetical protein